MRKPPIGRDSQEPTAFTAALLSVEIPCGDTVRYPVGVTYSYINRVVPCWKKLLTAFDILDTLPLPILLGNIQCHYRMDSYT